MDSLQATALAYQATDLVAAIRTSLWERGHTDAHSRPAVRRQTRLGDRLYNFSRRRIAAVKTPPALGETRSL